MKKILLFTLILALGITACSSSDDDPNPEVPEVPETEKPIEIPEGKDNIVLNTGENGTEVKFTTTGSWSIDVTDTRSSSWCTVAPTSGDAGEVTITITAEENISLDERKADINIHVGDDREIIKLTQQSSIPASESSRRVDSLVLVKFYETTNGKDWTDNSGWKQGSIDTWKGVYVDAEKGRVTFINLSNNNLNGELPSYIHRMDFITGINVSHNKLSGSLPSSFVNLSNAWNIRLEHNEFTGTIPSGLHKLEKLKTFNLAFNKFSGKVPSELIDLDPFILGPQNGTTFENYDWGTNSAFPELIGEMQVKTLSVSGHNFEYPVWIVQDTKNAETLLVKGLEYPTPLKLKVTEQGNNYTVKIELPQIGKSKYYYSMLDEFFDTKYQYYTPGGDFPPTDTEGVLSGTTAKDKIELNFDGGFVGSMYNSSGEWSGYMPNVSATPGNFWIIKP